MKNYIYFCQKIIVFAFMKKTAGIACFFIVLIAVMGSGSLLTNTISRDVNSDGTLSILFIVLSV